MLIVTESEDADEEHQRHPNHDTSDPTHQNNPDEWKDHRHGQASVRENG